MNVFFAVADFLTQVAAGGRRASCSCSIPDLLVRQVDFGTAPTVADFLIAIPVAWWPTRASRRSRTWPRRRATTARRSRAGSGLVVGGRGGDLRLPAGGRAVGDAGRGRRDRCSPCPRRRAATPATRSSAWWRTWTSAPSRAPPRSTWACSPPRSSSSPRTPGLIGVSRLTYSMGQHRQLPEALRALHPRFRTPYVAIVVFGPIACLAIVPGQADFLGDDLRVRRDALVHDGPRRR